MATKPKKADKPDGGMLKRKRCEVKIRRDSTEEEKAAKYAKIAISPMYAAVRVVSSADGKTSIWEELDVPSMADELRNQAAAVNRGDLAHVEAMLMNQATALQTLFARMTERAMTQTHMPNIEGFMRMALRSQSQCRATLETLAAIKNPPAVFAKQANISNGPQQVNNGAASSAHVEKTINQQNELLEVQHGSETMDTRTASAAGGTDPAMATLGEINRG
jgi:Tfp pilus assembly protein PilE